MPLPLQYSSRTAVNPALSGPDTEMDQEYRMGTLDPNFGLHLTQYEIHEDDYHLTQPNNWDELRSMVARPRQISPSESYDAQYQAFRQAELESSDKLYVKKKIIPVIRGSSHFGSEKGHSFQNMGDITNGSIVKAQPDFYDGVRFSALEKVMYEQLRPFIKPLVAATTPVVPNFFGVFRGRSTSDREVKLLARYSGAIGARGIHRLRSFGVEDKETVYDNNAYTISATYLSGTLTLYAHRPIAPSVPGGRDIYRMTRFFGSLLIDSPGEFRRGVEAFRKARKWACEKRKELVAAANARTQTTTRTQDANDGQDAGDRQDAIDGADANDRQDANDGQDADDGEDANDGQDADDDGQDTDDGEDANHGQDADDGQDTDDGQDAEDWTGKTTGRTKTDDRTQTTGRT